MSARCKRHGHGEPCPLCLSAAVETLKNPGGGMKLVSHGWNEPSAHVVGLVVPDPVPREPGPRIDLMKALDDSLKAPRRACLALAAIGFAFQRIVDNDTTHRAIKRANWGWARTESKKLAEAILCALHDDVDEAIGGTPELPEEGA